MTHRIINHTIRTAFLACLASILLTSCEDLLVKELDIEEDFNFTEQLGLSGSLVNNYTELSAPVFSRILLAENQSVVDQVAEPVYFATDALDLYKDGDYFNTFTSIPDGQHINQVQGSNDPSFVFEPADYRIEVDHPEFGFISAETQMPNPVFVNSIEIDSFNFGGAEFEDETRYLVTVQFDDPPSDNYYKIDLDADAAVLGIDTVIYGLDTFTFERRLDYYIESINLQGAQESYNGGYLFDDSVFDDSEFTFTFNMVVFNGDDLAQADLEELFSLKWSCLSEELYNFETSYTNFRNSQDFGPFSEPVSVYTNVENGLGYFGAENYYFVPFDE